MPSSTLHALSSRIARTIPLDRSARSAVLEDLRAFRQVVPPTASKDLRDRLDASVLLLEMMNRVEVGATADSLQVVARLLAVVEEEAPLEADGGRSPAESAASAHEHPGSAPEERHRGPHPGASAAGRPGEPRTDAQDAHADLRLSHDVLLGQLLVETGTVSLAQVGEALRSQLRNHLPLGKVLVMQGCTTQGQVDEALELQSKLRGEVPSTNAVPASHPESKGKLEASGPKPFELRLTPAQSRYMRGLVEMLLGETLIRLGCISREQLEEALRVQRAAGTHIGEALVETGAATWEQIKKGLRIQEQNKQGA